MTPIKKILHVLFVENNPTRALDILFSSFKDPAGKDAPFVYQAWKNVRRAIFQEPDRYAHPHYEHRMMTLQKKAFPWEKDFETIGKIINAPVGTRIRYQQNKNPRFNLDNEDLNKEFKTINVLQDVFYEFTLPDAYSLAWTEYCKQANLDQQRRKRRSPSYYNFTDEDAERFVTTATKYLSDLTPEQAHKTDIICALQILTGRRCKEICSTATIYPVPGEPYQFKMKGMAKQDAVIQQDNTETPVFPLLCPYPMVENGFRILRTILSSSSPVPCASSIHDHQIKMFGVKLTHTQYRGIYTSLAYKHRHTNHFHADVSRDLFHVLSLGHTQTRVTPTQLYTTITVNPDV